MEGIIIKLKNKRKNKKYIKVTTPESRKTKDCAMIYLYDDRICISQCKGISIDDLREIGYRCFYWLMHDDDELKDITYIEWEDSILSRMKKYQWFDSWNTVNIIIDSFNIYKRYL